MSNLQIPVSPPSTPLLYSTYSLSPSPSSSYASLTSSASTKNLRQRPLKWASNTSENIQVMVRCRPPSDMETKADEPICWKVIPEEGLIKLDESNGPAFEYDKVFKGIHNTEIYESGIQKLVRSTMEGYNGTVFAYGQTASGKTYTMTGTKEEPGLIPKAIQDVFAHIKEAADREYSLQMSYMEIYNEKINDLLNPDHPPTSLKIRTANGQDYVENLGIIPVATPKEVMDYIKLGDARRHTSETDYNGKSSRSHTIFQLIIQSKSRLSSLDLPHTSRLNLIDLAGSEKVATSNDRRKESSFINKSLMTLGKVIIQLNDGSKHIQYRDSQLTRILSSSLSGNDYVAVICTINPALNSKGESTNTLRFAQSVKKVRINPKNIMAVPRSGSPKEQASELEIQMQIKMEQESETKERLSHLLCLVLTHSKASNTETNTVDISMEDIVKKCEDNLTLAFEQYQQEIKKKEAEGQQLGERLASSVQNLSEKSVVIEELQVAIQDYQRINEELQSQLDKYRNSFAEVNKRWNGLESSIKDYKERLVVSEGKVTMLEAQRKADEHTKQRLEQQLEDSRTELEHKIQEDRLLGMVQSIRDDEERLEELDHPRFDQERWADLEKQLQEQRIQADLQRQNHTLEMEKERERSSLYKQKIDQVQDKLYKVETALKQAKLDEVEHALKRAKHDLSAGSLSQPPSLAHPVVRYLHLGQGAWILLLAFGIWLFL